MTGRDLSRLAADAKARVPLSELVREVVALRRQGRDLAGLCPFHAERTPSFTVVDDRGFYWCFGCGAGGDAVDWLRAIHGLDFGEAVAELAARAGLDPPEGATPQTQRPRKPRPLAVRPDPSALVARDREAINRARGLWRAGVPVPGTVAAAYLRRRGIAIDPPASLRAAPTLDYWAWDEEAKQAVRVGAWPALLCAVQAPGPAGAPVQAVQAIWLASDGSGKARPVHPGTGEVLPAKRSFGRFAGGALRLGPGDGPALDLAEGPETGLSLVQALGRPVWATLSLANLAGGGRGRGRPHPDGPGPDGRPRRLPSPRTDPDRPGVILPATVRLVRIAEDADNGDPAAADCLYARVAARWTAEGRRVERYRPAPGTDFNDMLMAEDAA